MLSSGLSIANFVRVHMPESVAARGRPSAPVSSYQSVDWEARGSARAQLLQAVRALDELDRIVGLGRRGAAEAPRAMSSADIGLDPSPATAARLESVEEVNATPTSFSPYAPAWSGASTAALVLDGEYDGSSGTDTLTFKSRRNGTHGVDNLRIEVRNSAGDKLDTVNIKDWHAPDRVYTLSSGITFTLGAGDLRKNDTLTVSVFDGVGTAVDPDRPLDGTGASDARLESAFTVSAGTFTVNGEAINVFSGDSINDVLGRIDASAAGVTATFDAATERVVLTQKTPGSAAGIVLGADTSGFLAATKLDTAITAPGSDYEPSVALAGLAQFSGVTSGTIRVNGVGIAIDVATDSLDDVLASINASGAGVTATLLSSAQRVSIVNSNSDRDLTLDDGGTGFLAALQVAPGTYQASLSSNRLSRPQSYRAADALEALQDSLRRLTRSDLAQREPMLRSVSSGVQGALNATLDSVGERALSKLGVPIEAQPYGPTRLSVDDASRRSFAHQLQRNITPLQDLMLGERRDDSDGLIGRLRGVLESAVADLRSSDSIGAFVNLSA